MNRNYLIIGIGLVALLAVVPAGVSADYQDTTNTTESNGNVTVTTLATGQALATVIETPEQTIVYDTGPYYDNGEQVINYLKERNISTVEHLVVSHSDSDHVGGAEGIIDYVENETTTPGITGAVWDGGTTSSTQTWTGYRDTVLANNITFNNATRAGDTIPAPTTGLNITVLNPPVGEDPVDSRANDYSVALLIDYKKIEWILAGDISKDYETEVYTSFSLDRLDIESLGVGHHGADTSTSSTWLQVLEPEVATVSAPNSSTYNHPEPAVLSRLETTGQVDTETYWTGKHGTVSETSNGETLTVSTQFDRTTNGTVLRDAPARNTTVSVWELDSLASRLSVVAQELDLSPPPATDTGSSTNTDFPFPVIVGAVGLIIGGLLVASTRR